jgi:pilus assembly protein CpaD
MPKSSCAPNPKAGSFPALLCLGFIASSLSACGTRYASNDGVSFLDYHERHPIVLAQAPTTMDLFPVGGRVDPMTAASIRSFAERYRTFGTGNVVILAPSGGRERNGKIIDEIRGTLYANGLRGNVSVSSYRAADPTVANPVRLVFQGLKATTPSRCGQWPSDLASGGSIEGWKNEPYENFGCATQATLAAQVDDPRDIAGQRASTPPDEDMRLRAIDAVRRGEDPGTNWKTQNTPIGLVGAGG